MSESKPVRVHLHRVDGAQFIAENEAGNRMTLDGPEDVGGRGQGLRPMQTVLAGLAGCMAVDILHILQKGRHRVDDLTIDIDGWRADAVPAVYTKIHLRVRGAGDFEASRLDRAVALSLEKYCSVARMLEPMVEISAEAEVLRP